jgi:hypothetical protein
MLRITQVVRPTGRILLVEGTLVGPWVAELRRAAAEGDARTTLDLAGVAYADDDGVAALRDLRGAGVELTRASGFLTALIGTDDEPNRD